MPMFGQMTETLSSIDSSMRMEEDFFSVAMTIPFDAVARQRAQALIHRGSVHTFDTQASGSLRYCGQCVLDLNELAARREDREGVAKGRGQDASKHSAVCSTNLYAPPPSEAICVAAQRQRV